MPSRKQRRRREKAFRHEYETVLLDEEGNEVAVDPDELRAEREARERAKAESRPASATQQPARGRARTVREVPPPSWERALRRGGIMGALMLVAFVFLFRNGAAGGRIAIGLFYAVAFVPLTYWIDRTAYRAYVRRLARESGKEPQQPARRGRRGREDA
jgi:hypothetical protein